jgi:hypothetical protein
MEPVWSPDGNAMAYHSSEPLNSVMREIYEARVWAGLHWRHSMLDGAQIGRKVSKYVCDHFFLPAQ